MAKVKWVPWLAAGLVVLRALASSYFWHFSDETEWARGAAFVYGYDAVFTHAPLLIVGLIAWAASRHHAVLTAYGYALLLLLLIGPPVIAQRKFSADDVVGSSLLDPWLIASVMLCASSVALFLVKASRARRIERPGT